MGQPLVIALDSSTSATKAIVINPKGEVVSEGKALIDLISEQMNHYEHDPRQWWTSTKTAIEAALSQLSAEQKRDIAAIGITHQRESFALVDKNGEPLRRAILWLDSRAGAQIRAYGSDAIHELSGKPADTTPALYKLAWLKEHEPETLARAALVSDVHAYLSHALTGRWASATGSADTLNLFDIRTRTWSPELLEIAGLRPDQLVELVEPGEIIATLRPELANEWGISTEVVVVGGVGDGQAAGLGSGAITPGVAYVNVGTSIVAGVHSPEYAFDKTYRTLVAGMPGHYVLECVQNSGSVLGNWFRKELGDPAKAGGLDPDLEAAASAIPAGAEGLLALPYWNAVQSPYWNPFAKGAVLGFGSAHTRAHMYRALFEGMAYELALNIEGMNKGLTEPVKEFRCMGGGSRSPLWRQILTDVTGIPFVSSEVDEVSAQGAAVIAMAAIGVYSSVAEASENMCKLGEVTYPNPQKHQRYREIAQVHRKIYPAIQDIFEDLRKLENTGA